MSPSTVHSRRSCPAPRMPVSTGPDTMPTPAGTGQERAAPRQERAISRPAATARPAAASGPPSTSGEKTAKTRSPMNLSIVPPWARMAAETRRSQSLRCLTRSTGEAVSMILSKPPSPTNRTVASTIRPAAADRSCSRSRAAVRTPSDTNRRSSLPSRIAATIPSKLRASDCHSWTPAAGRVTASRPCRTSWRASTRRVRENMNPRVAAREARMPSHGRRSRPARARLSRHWARSSSRRGPVHPSRIRPVLVSPGMAIQTRSSPPSPTLPTTARPACMASRTSSPSAGGHGWRRGSRLDHMDRCSQ